MKIAVIGGGAAGYFASISAKEHNPTAKVCLIEKSSKTLAKVKVSGGGRCNVTHNCLNNRLLSQSYPRGEKFLKKSFDQFSVKDTIIWFTERGVELKVEADNRMFPVSDDSQSIILALSKELDRKDVSLRLSVPVKSIQVKDVGFLLEVNGKQEAYDKVIIATGGSRKKSGFQWLTDLGISIVDPAPSLFTFNIPNDSVTKLMGISVPNSQVNIVGEKIRTNGPILITHWGMSGPAILKASALGAKLLAEKNYNFDVSISWIGAKEHDARQVFNDVSITNSQKKITNLNSFGIPGRLWQYLISKSEVDPNRTWNETSKKLQNRLINLLVNDIYCVKGKTTFKEEFVTAGGVVLSEIDSQTMESKVIKGLYFAGEVLDIDGITGGFNFQAAWTTGYIAGKHVGR
jgi:predicted Rossmann fold flavoprotein